MNINKSNQPAFGAVIFKFNQKDLSGLTPPRIRALNRLVAKNLTMEQAGDNFIQSKGTQNFKYGRYVISNPFNFLIGGVYANKKPEMENKFVEKFIKLMVGGDAKFELEHFSDNDIYQSQAAKAKAKMISDVMYSK